MIRVQLPVHPAYASSFYFCAQSSVTVVKEADRYVMMHGKASFFLITVGKVFLLVFLITILAFQSILI